MEMITWKEFEKVEMRVGQIVDAEPFAEAHQPAFILHVDFGDKIGIKKSSTQITDLYTPDDLIGKLIVGVVNFPDKQIGPMMSECLVTGFQNKDSEVVLCIPDKSVPLGSKLI
jgi:tRNA-binding protein